MKTISEYVHDTGKITTQVDALGRFWLVQYDADGHFLRSCQAFGKNYGAWNIDARVA